MFWVPADARWSHLQANAKQSNIGKIVDDAMVALERDNAPLKGVLPKDYARPGLDKQRLGELIDVIATIELTAASEGEQTHRSVDLLGRVYEYFLTRFASAEGKNGGQFYTPSCVVRCLVEMLAPYKGRIYDPACGSGGSEKFVESHSGKFGDISISSEGRERLRRSSRAASDVCVKICAFCTVAAMACHATIVHAAANQYATTRVERLSINTLLNGTGNAIRIRICPVHCGVPYRGQRAVL